MYFSSTSHLDNNAGTYTLHRLKFSTVESAKAHLQRLPTDKWQGIIMWLLRLTWTIITSHVLLLYSQLRSGCNRARSRGIVARLLISARTLVVVNVRLAIVRIHPTRPALAVNIINSILHRITVQVAKQEDMKDKCLPFLSKFVQLTQNHWWVDYIKGCGATKGFKTGHCVDIVET